MTIFGVSHIPIGVADMDAALPFYRDVLGLAVMSDFEQELRPDEAPELHRGRHIARRQVWLRQNDAEHSVAIALDQLWRGDPADRRADIYDLGIHHVGLWVDNIEQIVARARNLAYEVIMPHVAPAEAYGDPAKGEIASVFLRDPEGNLIQCDQRIGADDLPDWYRGQRTDEQTA